jgi:glycerol kinase
VLFVPSLAGLGAPFWAPEAKGGWLGLSLSTGREHLVRALVWGIAAQVASLARAMGDDVGSPLERLRVDGGLTRSKALMQAQADLLQAPVELYPSADATALGVGALARLGRLAKWEAAARALAELV